MAEAPMLETRGLEKRFGGLLATNGVSLTVAKGELHAIIGPNGAGKTTLIGQLAGELRPSAGTILLDGADATRWSADARARAGLARSFQITSVFDRFTVRQNVALAVQAHRGHSFRFWRQADRDPDLAGPADRAIAAVGLAARADTPVARLSHGERRQLELAMALAGEPRLLLLDEPMAGMGPDESRQMVTLLAGLKGRYAILLVEHDMDAVFALADRISVLVYGRLIASGPPDQIRGDAEVRAAYLGDAA